MQRAHFALAPLERLAVAQELGLARDPSAIALVAEDANARMLVGDLVVATDVIVVVMRGEDRGESSLVRASASRTGADSETSTTASSPLPSSSR